MGERLGFNPTLIDDAPQFDPLQRLLDDKGQEYTYVKAASPVAAGHAVRIANNGGVEEVATANYQIGERLGVAVAAIGTNKWGWVMIYGTTPLQVGANCTAYAVLRTTTTAGQLDDAGGGRTVEGVVLTAARGAGAGTAAAMLSYPIRNS